MIQFQNWSFSGTTLVNDVSTDYLAELEGDTLSLYEPGALDAIDKTWGMAAAGAVTTVSFKFIDFDELTKHLSKIRARFPAVNVSELYLQFGTKINSAISYSLFISLLHGRNLPAVFFLFSLLFFIP